MAPGCEGSYNSVVAGYDSGGWRLSQLYVADFMIVIMCVCWFRDPLLLTLSVWFVDWDINRSWLMLFEDEAKVKKMIDFRFWFLNLVVDGLVTGWNINMVWWTLSSGKISDDEGTCDSSGMSPVKRRLGPRRWGRWRYRRHVFRSWGLDTYYSTCDDVLDGFVG